MPCPISEFGATSVMVPLGVMLMNTLGVKSTAVAGALSANATEFANVK